MTQWESCASSFILPFCFTDQGAMYLRLIQLRLTEISLLIWCKYPLACFKRRSFYPSALLTFPIFFNKLHKLFFFKAHNILFGHSPLSERPKGVCKPPQTNGIGTPQGHSN